MNIISKLILIIFFITISLITYLSLIGVETKQFNNQISNKIKNINKNLEVELKEIKLVLDPIKFRLNIKTIGPKFKNRNKIIEIESIQTQISLKSLIDDKFSLENLEISTKSLEISNLISFIRSLNNTTELFILESIIKKGYLIADIKLEFDSEGKIRDNYTINGFVKDAKLGILKRYNIKKLNFIFGYKNDNLILEDMAFLLNDLNFFSNRTSFKKVKNEFIIDGNADYKGSDLNDENIKLFITPLFPDLNIKKIKFSSNNNFSFKVNKKLEFKDFKISSRILMDEFLMTNTMDLKKIFPKIKKNIYFSNNEIDLLYGKNEFLVNGNGNILFQDQNDQISYEVKKINKTLSFKTLLKIKENPFNLDFLDYEKDKKNQASIQFEGYKKTDNETIFDLISFEEKENKINIKKLILDEKRRISYLDSINIDVLDKENNINKFDINKKNNNYVLRGKILNANNFIENLLDNNQSENNLKVFSNNFNIDIKVDKLILDQDYNLNNFEGNLSIKNQEVINGNLVGFFPNKKQLKFKIKSIDSKKITTLYLSQAEAIVSRYKFIKGFNGGLLDFYSSKRGEESISKIKIYDFKLKELPVLTKLLTLASLQGIADLLSGEGIGFDEFEMNYKNKKNLMIIDEIYAIGPAISILMDGYVEKNKTISLRGTLVPATTINKAIGSIPLLGQILVGSKTGEGVFGVSFKIKGPPGNLQTSVNPIKTLTPRFITRTLEKIKKN